MSAKTIRVGLLGAGYIADWHGKALKTVPGAVAAAVCDQSRDRAEALARPLGVSRVHTSLDEMLAAGGLDAVHVLLPPMAHATTAKTILDAGLPVYVEKPMCLRPDECRDLESHPTAGRLAVGHNFLFDPAYERLKADLATGRLGKVEHVTVVWAKEFGPVRSGPFGMWALRHPANILLEVAPHAAAHVLDLAGPPDRLDAEALDPVLLPGGVKFFRRWLVRSFHGKTCVDTRLSFGSGFPEHRVEVRGSAGTATVDYERGTYVLRRRTHLPDDFDRYARTTAEARELARQARRNLTRYALSKAKLVRDGNAFGASIAGAVRAFYSDLPAVKDPRLTAEFGGRVVRTCLDIAKAAGFDPHEEQSTVLFPPHLRGRVRVGGTPQPDPSAGTATGRLTPHPNPPPQGGREQKVAVECLVLGGTGFIGRAVVRRMTADGRRVRVLARDPANLPDDLRADGVDVCRGDLGRPGDLARALDGVPAVIHLARSHSKTWDEYLRDDIGVTRAVAEACMAAGVKRLVYTGTTDSYYSGRDETITEATPLDPKIHRRNLYARAKAEAERLLLDLHRERGLPVVVARPAVVVGPGGDPHHWGVGMWATPDACRFWGDGNHPVPLVLVDDVADALVRCLDADGAVGEAFNLASDPLVTPREYVVALAGARGTWIDARPTPAWRFYASDLGKWAAKCLVRHPGRRLPSYRDWQSRTYRATYDCSKAKRVLGWLPAADKETLLEQGARRPAVEWSA